MDITLFVEHLCDLRCTYCYTGQKARRTMPDDVMRATIPFALADAPQRVTVSFFGGEPLLCLPLLRRTVEAYRAAVAALATGAPRLHFVLNSNLTHLNDEVVRFLVAEGFAVNASLDGPEAIHDAQRMNAGGGGTYHRVAAGLRQLEAAGVPFQLTAVVTPRSAPELGRVTEELFRYRAQRATLAPELSADWSEGEVEGLRRGALDAAAVWASEFRAGRHRAFEPLQTKVLSGVLGSATAPRCTLRLHELVVSTTGNFYTCGQLVGEDRDSTHRIGSLSTGIDWAALAALRQQKERTDEVCAPCDLRSRCSAECGCKQVSASGALGVIDGLLCDTEAAFIDAADSLRATLQKEKVPAFAPLLDPVRWQLKAGAALTPLRRSRDAIVDR